MSISRGTLLQAFVYKSNAMFQPIGVSCKVNNIFLDFEALQMLYHPFVYKGVKSRQKMPTGSLIN
jgi:hypothetical protein